MKATLKQKILLVAAIGFCIGMAIGRFYWDQWFIRWTMSGGHFP